MSCAGQGQPGVGKAANRPLLQLWLQLELFNLPLVGCEVQPAVVPQVLHHGSFMLHLRNELHVAFPPCSKPSVWQLLPRV